MKDFFKKFAVAYLAGALGGLAYALIAWWCGYLDLYRSLHVHMSGYALTWGVLSDRMLWGSLWGLLIIVLSPLLRARGVMLGFILSLVPSAYTLLILYPQQGQGLFGAGMGTFAFAFVLLFNAAWGIVAGLLYDSQYRS